jgi:hypothetical protein
MVPGVVPKGVPVELEGSSGPILLEELLWNHPWNAYCEPT